MKKISRPLHDCLKLDWPHALGKSDDEKGKFLIWITKSSFGNWQDTMKELARIKIAFRTELYFSPNRHHRVDQRHLLAYPVTHHNFNSWGNQSRIANQLRFKVLVENQQFFGLAYHLPCGIPNKLLNALSMADRTWIIGEQLSVWEKVHGILDQQMQRI